MNWIKTFLLMGFITALFLGVGYLIGGQQGMIIALGLAFVMNFASYWYSDKIVLAMYQAQEIDESQAPRLFGIVRGLVSKSGMPMPRVYIIPVAQPNAFATGRDPEHAAVAVTDGILRILNEDELEGVLAHELSHVRNRDILIGTVAATIAGAIMMLRYFAFFFGGGRDDREGGGGLGLLVALIVAPIAAVLIQLWISRTREYSADESGARMSGKPWALASALQKLQRGAQAMPMKESNPATAHMFIVNPFSAQGLTNLFSTHPPIEERVRKLEAMHV